MKTIRIVIADDHALVRRGIANLLGSEKGFSVVAEATNGEEACAIAKNLRPDVIIMDLSMPAMDGVEATKVIHTHAPETKILVLTTFGTSIDVCRAMEAGAIGALVKDTDESDLIEAIRAVSRGETVLSPEIRAMIATEPHPAKLTSRQEEILRLTIRGLSSKAIATHIGISTDAVNQHLNAIRNKLGAANRVEAIAIALKKHLLNI